MLRFKLFIAAIILAFAGNALAQNSNGSRTVNKSTDVPSGVTIDMNNHSGDLKITTTSSNNVKLKTTIEVTGDTPADEKKVLQSVEDFKFELHGDDLEIDTRFYKNMNTNNNRSTMTLLNGDKVKVRDFKIRHELEIPKSADLELNNKYSDIEMESLDGKVDLTIYSSKLYAHDFSGETNIQSKYSKIKLGNIKKDAEFDLYDTDIEMESCGDMELKSKYSKFVIEKAGKLEIDSYDDKFTVEELTGLDLNSKYSDFNSEAVLQDLNLELYDCNIKVKSARNARFNGKYCDLTLGDVANITIDDSYDNNIYLGNTQKIDIGTSKYSLYEIKSVSGFSLDDGYDDNIKIGKLNNDFSGLTFNGKYGKIEADAGSVKFKVDFNIKYPKVDIPESVKISKQIKDNSNLELIGGESGGTIKITGYDMKVVIDD